MEEETTGTGFLKFNVKDLSRAFTNAAAVAIVMVLYTLTAKEGFDLFSVDWLQVGKDVLNAVIITLVGSIGGPMLTTKKGNFLGAVRVK